MLDSLVDREQQQRPVAGAELEQQAVQAGALARCEGGEEGLLLGRGDDFHTVPLRRFEDFRLNRVEAPEYRLAPPEIRLGGAERRAVAAKRISMLDHNFTGPPFTIGVEEELMILDPDDWSLAQSIEELLAAGPRLARGPGEAGADAVGARDRDHPVRDDRARSTAQLRELREVGDRRRGAPRPRDRRRRRPTPSPVSADQEIVDRAALPRADRRARDRSRRNELIFGTHVHVAIEGADRAIYVADGIRRYLPLLLALSTNSPFWVGERTGLM